MRFIVPLLLLLGTGNLWAQEPATNPGLPPATNVVNYLNPTGMTQVMIGADDDMIKVDLGHDFPYYGGTFDTAWMSSNGFIMLYDEETGIGNPNVLSKETYLTSLCCEQDIAADSAAWNGYTSQFTLPDDIFSYMIGPLWSDLEDTSDETDAGFYWSTSATAGVSSFLWYNINEYGYDDSPQTFQLNLWSGGSFDFLYDMIDLDQEAVYVGFSGPTSLQSQNQTVYTQLDYSPYDEAYSMDDILFTSANVTGGKEWYGQDAGYSLDCSSALNFPQCPGYDAALLNQQCTANSQYSSACPGYVDPNADNNSGLTEEEQCQINPMYSYNCDVYFSYGDDHDDNNNGSDYDDYGNSDNMFGGDGDSYQGDMYGGPDDYSTGDMGMPDPNEESFFGPDGGTQDTGSPPPPGGPQDYNQGPGSEDPYQDPVTVDMVSYTTQPEHNVDPFPAEQHYEAHHDEPNGSQHQYSNQNPPSVDVVAFGGPEPDHLDVFDHTTQSMHQPTSDVNPIIDLELADLPDRVVDDIPSITREPSPDRPESIATTREPLERDVEDEIRELEEPRDSPVVARVSRVLEPVVDIVDNIEERAPVPTTQSATATTSVAAAITKQQVTIQLNVATNESNTNSTDTSSQQFESVDVSSVTTVAGISEQQDSSQDQQFIQQDDHNKQQSPVEQDVAYVEQQNQQSSQHDGSQYNQADGSDTGYQMGSEGLTQFGVLEPTQMLQPFDNSYTGNTGEDAAAMAEQPSFGITDVTFEEKLTESIATGASIGGFLSGSTPDFSKFDVKPPNTQQKVDTVKVESLAEKMTEESVQENAQKMADQMQESGGFVDQTTAVVLININPMFSQYYNTTAQQQPSWYRSETIYKNNKTIDDSMSLYMMAGKSDQRHREMVLQQYGR